MDTRSVLSRSEFRIENILRLEETQIEGLQARTDQEQILPSDVTAKSLEDKDGDYWNEDRRSCEENDSLLEKKGEH